MPRGWTLLRAELRFKQWERLLSFFVACNISLCFYHRAMLMRVNLIRVSLFFFFKRSGIFGRRPIGTKRMRSPIFCSVCFFSCSHFKARRAHFNGQQRLSKLSGQIYWDLVGSTAVWKYYSPAWVPLTFSLREEEEIPMDRCLSKPRSLFSQLRETVGKKRWNLFP